jgi:hypothetical protein
MLRKRQNPRLPLSTGYGRRILNTTTDRVDRLETAVETIQQALDGQLKLIADLQTDIYRLDARARRR